MSKIVPRYWAEARLRHQGDGRQLTLRRWGWSDIDHAEAQLLANRRVQEAMDRAMEQWPSYPSSILRREPKRAYNGADGVPVREEIIDERGEDVITRNSYGARCLNTPDVFIADIDTADLQRLSLPWCLLGAVLAMCLGAAWWWSWMQSGPAQCLHPCPSDASLWWALAWRMLLFLAVLLPVLGAAQSALVRWRDGAVGHARRRLRRRPGAWALYRTPAGARIIALHMLFDPRAEHTQQLMKNLSSDCLYRRMCRNQGCFRARVSAKPWRIPGVSRLRGPTWPIEDPGKLQARQAWVDGYEQAQSAYAACVFVDHLGNYQPLPRAQALQDWHDELCQARSSKPLA